MSYDQMIREAVNALSIYGNYTGEGSASDPALTMLEQLTAFSALRREESGVVTEEMREAMLSIAGFFPLKERQSVIGVQSPGFLYKCQPLKCDDLVFELKENYGFVPVVQQAYFAGADESGHPEQNTDQRKKEADLTPLFDKSETTVRIPVDTQSVMYLLFNRPLSASREYGIYVGVTDEGRSIPEEGFENPFAKTRWEIFTSDGWLPLETTDETHSFLKSGMIWLKAGDTAADNQKCIQEQMYAVRCTFEWSRYDKTPVLQKLAGLYAPAMQCQSHSEVISLKGGGPWEIRSGMLPECRLKLYKKVSGRTGNLYIEKTEQIYDPVIRMWTQQAEDGRTVVIHAGDEEDDGGADGKDTAEYLLIMTRQSFLPRIDCGTIQGYEGQIFLLPSGEKPLLSSLCPAIEGGTFTPETLFPVPCFEDEKEKEKNKEWEGPYLVYDREKNGLRLYGACMHGTASLILAGYQTFEGVRGNLRPFTDLKTEDGVIVGTAPTAQHGADRESSQDLTARFKKELNRPWAIVSKDDAVRIVKSIPGLLIDKMTVLTDSTNRRITIVVRHRSEHSRTVLLPIYERQIKKIVEERRMLSWRIDVRSPRYTKIHIKAVITTKLRTDHMQNTVGEYLRRSVDMTQEDGKFGALLSYEKIYRGLEELPGADRVDELILSADSSGCVYKNGADLQMKEDVLCFPGEVNIIIRSLMSGERER